MSHALKLQKTHSHTPATAPRILLVEDEVATSALLSSYMKEAGYQVDEALNGEEAWSFLKKNRAYDLIITDRLMPKLDGIELCTRMKRDSGLHHIPVIMQTAAATPQNIAEGIRAGVYYYLTKPYQEQALLSLVRSALREHQQYRLFNERFTQQNTMLDHFERGIFTLRTPEQAQDLALLLGGIFPRPELAVTGMYEIMLNAIEHGMLEIGYDTKNTLLTNKTWDQEVTTRLSMPQNQTKQITVEFSQTPQQLQVKITDPGQGFDWQNYLTIEPARATKANGRGIAKANLLSFDKVNYNNVGNSVELISRRNG